MNAILAQSGFTRLIIPNIERQDYLNNLMAWSTHQDPKGFMSFIEKMGRVMLDVDWTQEPKDVAAILISKNALSDDNTQSQWIFGQHILTKNHKPN